jgi:3-deoxy-manno-octulosonate cytidylyltransferase (CMP-KDO synthetase)
MSAIIVIPARMASTRLPGKPLVDIAGVPMITRVWRQALAADVGPVVVAAAEREIVDVIAREGGTAYLTDPDLPSGTDRVFAAVQEFDPEQNHDVVVNLQGDLPALDPENIRAVVEVLAATGSDIATLAAQIDDSADYDNPSVVKPAIVWHFIFRAREFPRARALYSIISASMPSGARRSHVSCNSRLRRWKSAKSWNNCARSKRE